MVRQIIFHKFVMFVFVRIASFFSPFASVLTTDHSVSPISFSVLSLSLSHPVTYLVTDLQSLSYSKLVTLNAEMEQLIQVFVECIPVRIHSLCVEACLWCWHRNYCFLWYYIMLGMQRCSAHKGTTQFSVNYYGAIVYLLMLSSAMIGIAWEMRFEINVCVC